MLVSVLLFGPAKDFAKGGELRVEVGGGASLAEVRGRIVDQVPGLAMVMARSRMAVNRAFVGEDHVIHEGDEIAVIPPVSGG